MSRTFGAPYSPSTGAGPASPSSNGHRPPVARQAADDEIDLREILGVLRRNRAFIAGSFLAAVLVAVAAVLRMTPVYESATSILVDEKRTELPVLDVLQSLSGGSEIDTEMEVLRSRTLAEDVVDSLALQVTLAEPSRVPRGEVFTVVELAEDAPEGEYVLRADDDGRFRVVDAPDSAVTSVVGDTVRVPGATLLLAPGAASHGRVVVAVIPAVDAVDVLRETIKVSRPNREANIAVVTYQATDRQLVRDVPNALAVHYMSRRREIRKTEARSTVSFLREQIDTLGRQLRGAEDALRAFREGKQVVNLEAEAGAQVSRLADMQAQRNGMDAERSALQQLLDEIRAEPPREDGRSPYRRLIAFPTLFRNQAATELLRSLAAVEDERSALLTRRLPQDPDVMVLTDRVHQLEDQLRTIAVTYLQGLGNQVQALDASLARFGSELERIPAKEVQFARLQRQAKVLEEIYTLLQTRLKEAEIAAAVEDPSVRVVDPAIAPVEPVKPRKALSVGLAGMLGLLLGIAVAFVREHLDRSIQSREELQQATGLTVLGAIPHRKRSPAAYAKLRGRLRRGAAPVAGQLDVRDALVTALDAWDPMAEAYRALRTNITFMRPDRMPRSIVFTSPLPGDGKSTTAANFALTLVRQGQRVLLVDADMRRGGLQAAFGVTREPGLSNVLAGGVAADRAIQEVTIDGTATLGLLATGTLPPNPAELLGSTRMNALLEELAGRYDHIVIDAPPLNLVTDAAIVGAKVDGVIVVARAGTTEQQALGLAVEQLANVHAPVLGAVLNDVRVGRGGEYYAAYAGYYGATTQAG